MEAFKYKKLSKEEQEQRGILGRLVGIIADYSKATRNGRKYGEQLWRNTLKSDLFKEQLAARAILGELGHPEGREEIKISEAALCLAEMPKIMDDGKIFGVFDILSTPCGQILKTLCDYGTHIGISSRGQGDLIQNWDGDEEVDPDTYALECWDAVLLPAVKEARLQYVTESLNTKKLNKALTENINKVTPKQQRAIKEQLNKAGILLQEGIEEDFNELKAIADEFNKSVNYEFEVYPSGDGQSLVAYIDGDWKHDHARFKLEFEGFLRSKGYDFDRDVEESESDDDSFEAEYTYTINRGKDSMAMNEDLMTSTEKSEKEIKKEKEEKFLGDQVGAFSKGIEVGTVLTTVSGHRIKITKLVNKLVDGKLKAFFEYDYITRDGKKGHGANDDDQFQELLTEEFDGAAVQATDVAAKPFGKKKGQKVLNEKNPKLYDKICEMIENGASPEDAKDDFTEALHRVCEEYELTEAAQPMNFEDAKAMWDNTMVDRGYQPMDQEMYDMILAFGGNVPSQNNQVETDQIVIDPGQNDTSVADNDGTGELVEELRKTIYRVRELERDNLSLKEQLSVGNAQGVKMEEQLAQYKEAVVSLSNSAKNNPKLTKQVKELSESLKVYKESSAKVAELQEALRQSQANAKALKESVNNLKANGAKNSTQLEQAEQTLAKYRTSYKQLKESFAALKAQMSGVDPKKLFTKLNESYKLKDIDVAINELVNSQVRMNKLPVSMTENLGRTPNMKVQVKSSVYTRSYDNHDGADDISDALMSQLAQ